MTELQQGDWSDETTQEVGRLMLARYRGRYGDYEAALAAAVVMTAIGAFPGNATEAALAAAMDRVAAAAVSELRDLQADAARQNWRILGGGRTWGPAGRPRGPRLLRSAT